MIIYEHSEDHVFFLQLHLGGDRNFCYLLGDFQTKSAAAVDPGFGAARFAEAAKERDLQIEKILVTHGHSDHVGEAEKLVQLTDAVLYAGKEENLPNAVTVSDGEPLNVGQCTVIPYHTPGHSPGHYCYLFGDKLITGDLLFCGKVGGTGDYFPGSSPEAEWHSLQRVMKMPDEIHVFPGHDYYGGQGSMTQSTIGYEKEHNPFLLCEDYNSFSQLKANWEAYKAEHGIR
jgi:glyoxylase-like metal-dependent hydrolase (beta-lactamase superfamily II)